MRLVSEILVDALESFEGGNKWIKGRLFGNVDGYLATNDIPVAKAAEAERYCSLGAIYSSMARHGELSGNTLDQEQILPVIAALSDSARKRGGIVITNDRADSFEPVKEMFCNGIKKALTQEEHASKAAQYKGQ